MRVCPRTVVIALALFATRVSVVTAQGAAHFSLVEQVNELTTVAGQLGLPGGRKTLTDGGLTEAQVDTLAWFLKDPLCAKPTTGEDPKSWCTVLFSPVDANRVYTPSVALIQKAYIATQSGLLGTPNGLGGVLGTPLSPAGYARAAGVADFILERAKDEVVVTFAIDFRKRLADDPLFKATFTRTLAATVDLESRSVKELLPSVRAAFTADLDSLPLALLDEQTMTALVGVLKSRVPEAGQKAIQARFDSLKPALPIARTVGARVYRIARGENPLTVLSSFESVTKEQLSNTPVRAAFVTSGIIAREYRADRQGLVTMAKDSKSRTYLLALLLRDVAGDVNDNAALIAWMPQFVTRHQADLVNLVQVARDIDSQMRALPSAGDAGFGHVDVVAGAVVHSAVQLTTAVEPLINPAPASWTEAKRVLIAADRIHSALASKQYVTGLMELNTFAFDEFGARIPPKYAIVWNTASSIAAAQTPEEASAALEAAAAPVLSFRAKRASSESHGSGMFGINSYASYAYGSENAFGRGFGPSSAQYTGLTVPIGLEWSAATGRGFLSSVSLFIPLVDLGTVATFRLGDNGKTENTPTITLSQLVAPGAYGVFGLSKSIPISVGIGLQYVPGLRRSANGTALNTVRTSGWIGVDVPLFHF